MLFQAQLVTELNDGMRSSVSTDEAMQNKGLYSQGLVNLIKLSRTLIYQQINLGIRLATHRSVNTNNYT